MIINIEQKDAMNFTLKIKKHHLNRYLKSTFSYCIENRKKDLFQIIIARNKDNEAYKNILLFTKKTAEEKIKIIQSFAEMKDVICQKNSVVAIELIINIKKGIENKDVLNIWEFITKTFYQSVRTTLTFDLMEGYIKVIFIPLSKSKDRWGNKKTRIGAKNYLGNRDKFKQLQNSFYKYVNN